MSDSKNSIAWAKIFEKYRVLDTIHNKGFAIVTANQINEFREARLMTKFDHKSQLPELFLENSLSILPISRGAYYISCIETFHKFEDVDVEIDRVNFPHFLESLDYTNITSEATAINCAFVSGIIQDFTQEDELHPTVSGRMSSMSFDFSINSIIGRQNISVENSQIEIDGGYEGVKSLNLIEAKNYISTDFLVRQLYYPYRLWNNKISKVVKPIFLTYTNGIFHLREFSFVNPLDYNSVRLVRDKKYIVQDGVINLEVIQEICNSIKSIDEPKIPFPQADSFERIINLCELLDSKSVLTKEDITRNYDFDARQTDYYINAGKYLGLIDIKSEDGIVVCYLTAEGEKLFNLSLRARQLEFVKVIIRHSVFKKVLNVNFEQGETPSKSEVVDIMKNSNLYNVGTHSTYFRRASTVIAWTNWILNLIEE